MKNRTPAYKVYNFDIIWRHVPMHRPGKEAIKTLLFRSFPFAFEHWAIYQNWKHARIFSKHRYQWWHAQWWTRKFSMNYPLPLAVSEPGKTAEQASDFALVIHSFYPDILDEILQQLPLSGAEKTTLYVTTPAKHLKEVEELLQKTPYPYTTYAVDNLGRDIYPFLLILPEVMKNGHGILLKLHTKKSNHLNRKDHWRNDLFEKLIGPHKVSENLKIFRENPAIGIIGPAKNILPMRLYYGGNAERVLRYAKMMGAEDHQIHDLNFVAGSMFYCRTSALLPLMNLQLSKEDFEKEAGQTDGTLAHVVERLFTVSALLSHQALADTHYHSTRPYYTVSKNHYFTI